MLKHNDRLFRIRNLKNFKALKALSLKALKNFSGRGRGIEEAATPSYIE